MRWLARRLLRLDDPWRDLQLQLDVAVMVAELEFPECSTLDQRSMACMHRMHLFREAGANRLACDARRFAMFRTAHAWWIAGLHLQNERRHEAQRAMLEAQWAACGFGDFESGDFAHWASCQRPMVNEAKADAFAAKLWRRLGLPFLERPYAVW